MNFHQILFTLAFSLLLTACGSPEPPATLSAAQADTATDTAQAAADAAAAAADADLADAEDTSATDAQTEGNNED